MSWTDERVELLKKMWGEGQSASQIAKELGGVTRNAVIGKVHRLGLSNRAGAAPAPAAAAPAAAPKPEAKPKPAPKPVEAKARPAAKPAPRVVEDEVEVEDDVEEDVVARQVTVPHTRKAIIPAGQPLPPQPSANEISPEALAKVSEIEKKARRLTLMELTERTCKWPVGDPATENFWFCGLPTQAGKPYCEAHVGVAFQPMSSRRDRKR
ncbi:MAG: GcrA family cell cycle regulator [Paracoccaceae bacterium]|jgi:GcrA cell cycle regulator|uniref:GcrA family cell cycle regulator n=1 Tax=unclassified Seohaeicola TaxID=2641111 RepID=UPI00237AB82E|nr:MULTISPECIES: GcrA family cell cycle regulator [unclassified Seohaeicola]MDD9707079.1 GcrA family cell cycle regulator [Seohaeicola sp. 4SK31]MDD9734189.1 GcrA family cell cycle regulator [Seohaeicola sp. SP36]